VPGPWIRYLRAGVVCGDAESLHANVSHQPRKDRERIGQTENRDQRSPRRAKVDIQLGVSRQNLLALRYVALSRAELTFGNRDFTLPRFDNTRFLR